jgi:hypothetical protein
MVCKLCLQSKPLADSHIIPKFVGKWLKESSATGYLRAAENPNVRKQDLPTEKLLCYDCETLLSRWENTFAKEIFLPFREENKTKFNYDEWFMKFAVSLAWRTAITEIDDFRNENPYLGSKVDDALEVWRDFLLNGSILKGYEQHVFFLDTVINTRGELPSGFHWYTLRGTDATIVSSDKQVFLYIKLPAMVFWFGVYPSRMQGWKKTKIHHRGHISAGKQKIRDDVFGSFLLDRAKTVMAIGGGISSRQEQKIVDTMLKDPERAASSETMAVQQIEQYWREKQDNSAL